MLFGATKSKQTNKIDLKGLSAAAAASRRSAGLKIWQKLGLAILIGLLLALSTPGFDQWWLAWFMLAPFLVLLTKCRSNSQSLLCGLFFGLGYHLLALRFYSDANAHGSGQIFLLIWFVQAALLSLPVVAFAWLVNALPLRPGYIPYLQRPFFPYLIGIPLLWIFLHRGLAIAHPLVALWKFAPLPPVAIDALPYSQYTQLAIIQSAKFVGPFAVEFLLLLVNAAIASFLVELVNVQDRPVERVDAISPRLGAVMDLSIALGLVGLVWFFGTAEIRRINFVTGDLATNGSINKDYLSNENNQPKIPLAIIASDLFNISSDSSLAAIKHTSSLSEIMVLPQIGPDTNLGQSGNILDLLKKTASQNHNTVLVSLDHQVHGDTIREDHVYSPSGDFHAERSMVSSNEYSFLSSKSLPDSLKQWFFLNNENGPPSQNLSTIAKINWGKVAILGGSEINNSQLVANDVRHGASLIVFQSNIDWARNKCLGKQLLAAAIMRAVENNRHVIVSAGNSVMAIIEPTGLVRSLCLSQYKSDQSTGEKSGIILSTVQFLWSKTPFTKMWWL